MRYCSNQTCEDKDVWINDNQDYCRGCGTELTPCIRCRCGRQEINPLAKFGSYSYPKFCSGCGVELTKTYLGECMSAQLKGMVGEISEKMTPNSPA